MRPDVTQRLVMILDWYKGMIAEERGRFVYTYDPLDDVAASDGSAIRDIGSIWDVEVLSRFLGRPDMARVVDVPLRQYVNDLVDRDGTLILDPGRLGEPSGIAHSAFMILSLLSSSLPEREAKASGLGEGILRQQRRDGSYKIHFGEEPDEGLEFHPGEAMLALMETYAAIGDVRYLESVERGFAFYRKVAPAPGLLVFHANWQSQYAALLHRHTSSGNVRRAVRDYAFALHDRILDARFYDEVAKSPRQQATVEVACALEGVNDAYSIAALERDARHMRAYERCIRVALEYLFLAQRLEGCTRRERGGFGHSLADRTQRIDVTGHVASGFIKAARNGLVEASSGDETRAVQ